MIHNVTGIRSFRILALLLVHVTVFGQAEYRFDKGLAIAGCHRYGREAIVTDQLAYQMARQTLSRPVAGQRLFTDADGQEHVWTTIQADSTGKFRGESIVNGYIYLEYNAVQPARAVLNITGNSMFYFNGSPRAGDIYSDGWMHMPVQLRKGLNEIYIRCTNFSRWQGVAARLSFPEKDVRVSVDDATLPHIVIGSDANDMIGGVVVVNHTAKPLKGLSMSATLNAGMRETLLPEIAANTIRKVPFRFSANGISSKGDYALDLRLLQNGRTLDATSLSISAVNPGEHQSHTFISDIDGSVQYYAVAPQTGDEKEQRALFLSVHGAGVQAIGQARAYHPKDWGVLVAPTNRRPRGFNWEDWGRLDALEVLELARKRYAPDPERIYLTGHSMGGHGTWYLGATYPDKWAAIAPCAGYPTLTGYGSADGRIPDSARTDHERTLLRASNASDVIALAQNYQSTGVYIFHGDDDRVVPVRFARQMRDVLAGFHPDFSYYEYPGGSHWFGNISVDWPPIFDYFRWHTIRRDSGVHKVDFVTANPGISSSNRWVTVVQQEAPLEFSEVHLERNRKTRSIQGTTKNVALLKLDLEDFAPGDTLTIAVDASKVNHVVGSDRQLFLRKEPGAWSEGRLITGQKSPQRSGTFKEAFNHNMVFVYATAGDAFEDEWALNKARYDAEVWYYRGNGAVDIVADNAFDPSAYPGRGVIVYGNATTNRAWQKLLRNCPVQVSRNAVTIGSDTFEGDDLAAYFTWPRSDSDTASVAVISGTGRKGLLAAGANQYFAAGSGFPDYLIFSLEMLKDGPSGIRSAGFFDNAWGLPAK